ncbi:MAG: hypothetical protein KJ749_10770 [Planctomycetes bacterium]|nr:hypothetical protein [Planctomycetota bacterium]
MSPSVLLLMGSQCVWAVRLLSVFCPWRVAHVFKRGGAMMSCHRVAFGDVTRVVPEQTCGPCAAHIKSLRQANRVALGLSRCGSLDKE